MTPESEKELVPKPLRVFGKIIKWLFIICAVTIIGWLTLCSIWQKGPSSVRKYSATEAAVDKNVNGSLQIVTLNEYNSSKLGTLFYISSVYLTKDIDQLQFTLRYNTYADRFSDDPIGFSPKDLTFELTAPCENIYIKSSENFNYRHIKLVAEGVDFSGMSEIDVRIKCRGETVGSCIVWMDDGYENVYKPGRNELTADEELIKIK